MAEISLKNLSKSYNKVHAIDDVSLTIADGEFVVFVGPSGCGKSTILRLIAGLEEAETGQILLDGKDITKKHPAERDMAMVFQSYALFPHMTVAQNIEFGLKVKKINKKIRKEKVLKAAKILQLENLLHRKPAELSGGQRQRVAIGRCIVKEPKVFLFDEPLSNLDAKLRVQMRLELENLYKELKATMIYVTHDQVEAMTMATRLVVLKNGCIEQFGKPLDVYTKPKTKFVAGFIGSPSMNFMKVQLTHLKQNTISVKGGGFSFTLKRTLQRSIQEAYIGIRPENLEGTRKKGFFSGKITLIERLGSESYVYVQLLNEKIVYKTNNGLHLHVGATIHLNCSLDTIHIFQHHNEQADELEMVN